jgi:two-component sensor histidine kinase
MALHELATNAVKYGALAGPQGRIAIRWCPDPDRPGFVRLIWREFGGPPVSEPERSGFGTRMLGRAFAVSGGEAEVRFLPDGVVCEMAFATLEASAAGASGAGEAAKATSEDGPPGP